jgi:hypothetical protein
MLNAIEVDYVCSWHQDVPKKAQPALTAAQRMQQQPWWVQPALGLYDPNVSVAMRKK